MPDEEIKLSSATSGSSSKSIAPALNVEVTADQGTFSSTSSTQSNRARLTQDGLVLSPAQTPEKTSVTVHDVAAFILRQQGEMTAMKLQKLVYYSQAWSLVWDEAPLFSEPIEAWANGPVVRDLYYRHQGQFKVGGWSGNSEKLSTTQQETVEKVLEFYGNMTSQQLSDLTHQEAPWREARQGLGPTDRGSREITHAAMFEYYSSL